MTETMTIHAAEKQNLNIFQKLNNFFSKKREELENKKLSEEDKKILSVANSLLNSENIEILFLSNFSKQVIIYKKDMSIVLATDYRRCKINFNNSEYLDIQVDDTVIQKIYHSAKAENENRVSKILNYFSNKQNEKLNALIDFAN